MEQDNKFANLFNFADTKKLKPIVKWAGGKEQELKYILPNLPREFNNFYEPFVGGGSVYTSISANKYFINDKSEELITLYQVIKNKDEQFYFILEEISHNWAILSSVTQKHSDFFIKLYKDFSSKTIDNETIVNFLYEFLLTKSADFNGMFTSVFNFNIEHFLFEIKKNILRKINRMCILEVEKGKLSDKGILDNIETAFKSAFYMHFRFIYNSISKYKADDGFKAAIFLFIRNYSYSGMFRYNQSGGFNVPYGGMGYNRKDFTKKIIHYKSKELETLLGRTKIDCSDFEDFLRINAPKKNDFIFLDPPYDTEFSTYAKNIFDKTDQERLSNYLVNECKSNWMLVIKRTNFIEGLYVNKKLNILSFDKQYLVSFMNRNEKKTSHLLIKNY